MKLPPWLPWTLVVALALIAGGGRGCSERAIGAAKAAAAAAKAAGDSARVDRDRAVASAANWQAIAGTWRRRAAVADTAFHVKQVDLEGLVGRLRASLASPTPSEPLAHLRSLCDSVATAALALAPACEVRVAARDSALRADSAALAAKDVALFNAGKELAASKRLAAAEVAIAKHSCPKWLGFFPKPLGVLGTGGSWSPDATTPAGKFRLGVVQLTVGFPIFGC